MVSKFTRNEERAERRLIAANIIAVAELGSRNRIPRNQIPTIDHRERLIRDADNNFGGSQALSGRTAMRTIAIMNIGLFITDQWSQIGNKILDLS
jgi:hypothetical protein